MGKFQATRKCFSLFLALVLVACNYSLQSHGRHIKTDTVASRDNSQPSLPLLKTSVNNVPTPSSEKKVDSPMMPNHDVAIFGDSSAAHTNAFQPTTPGNSPGVGHRSFKEEDNNVKVQSTDVEASGTEGSKDDFKPTDPGHSPGVGHAYQNKIGHLY